MAKGHSPGSDWARCVQSAMETRLRSNGATCWSASTACLGRQARRPDDQLASSCVAPAAATPLAACSTAQPPCGDAQRSSAHRRLAEMQEKFVLSCKRGATGAHSAARRVEIHIKTNAYVSSQHSVCNNVGRFPLQHRPPLGRSRSYNPLAPMNSDESARPFLFNVGRGGRGSGTKKGGAR